MQGTLYNNLTSKLGIIRGGGGGTQIWFRRGCAAEAAKPVPIFKGHFGGKGYPLLRVWRKGYPLLGVFSQENDVFVYFSDEMGENISIYSKITKVGVCLRIFQLKTIPYKIYSSKLYIVDIDLQTLLTSRL